MDVEPKRTYSQKMGCFIFWSSLQNLEENIPAIASLEDFKAAQKEGVSICACSMRFALCFTEMAQDRLEECLQAVVTGTHSRTVER
jgi:predicted peroxiredoxin